MDVSKTSDNLIKSIIINSNYLQYRNIGAHHLASWILSLIKRNDFAQTSDVSSYRVPIINNNKRNSELTSSIMGIPRTMIDNGKK